MRNLNTMLHEADAALLPILAQRWGITAKNLATEALIEALVAAMQNPDQVAKVYDSLDDQQRGALQSLHASKDHRLAAAMFEGIHGEIRKMGEGQITRQKPHEKPVSVAEALYYRGLIARGHDKVGAGIGPVIYIPEDLAKLLPVRKTGYSAAALREFSGDEDEIELGDDDAPETDTPPVPAAPAKSPAGKVAGKATPPPPPAPPVNEVQVYPVDADDIDHVRQADTSLVDDLTTVLAYLQMVGPGIDAEFTLEAEALAPLLPHLLVPDEARLRFMLGVGLTAELVEIQSGRAYPRRAEVRRWLGEKRSVQIKTLIDAWVKSLDYREVWHTPGLIPEAGWTYDPAVARSALLALARDLLPRQDWWMLDDFIDAVKVRNPNFQRPGGDFESWYIRSEEGEYLHGLNSWDAVEGGVLTFILTGPLHWLGLLDAADDAARLTAYGRVFIDGQPWLTPSEAEDKITMQADGTLVASRRVTRVDRFQLARFAAWTRPATLKGEPYQYRLDANSIQRAADQGITTEHIASFLKRVLDNAPLPVSVTRLLETWQHGAAAQVTLEQVLVLRTTSPETLDAIYNEPGLRRYLGARLGPMAVIVRGDQWEGLSAALGARGIEVLT